MRGEQVEISLARPRGSESPGVYAGTSRPSERRLAGEEGLVLLPIEDDARSALYLKAEDVTEAMDHGLSVSWPCPEGCRY
jgi:hypothetical protein